MDTMDAVDSAALAVSATQPQNGGAGDVHGAAPVVMATMVTNGCGDQAGEGVSTEADILLNQGVSQNHVPVAGRKRQREETYADEATKRVRTGGR